MTKAKWIAATLVIAVPLIAMAESSLDDGPDVVSYDEARRKALESFERAYVTDVLARAENSVAAAAKLAGIHRGYLYRLIDRYRLR
jgi:transcriptional regulator with PAS, ATPase and Fis domain